MVGVVVAFTLLKMSSRDKFAEVLSVVSFSLLRFFCFCVRIYSWFVANKKKFFMLLLFADGTCAFRKIYTIARKQSFSMVCARRLNHIRHFMTQKNKRRRKTTRKPMTNNSLLFAIVLEFLKHTQSIHFFVLLPQIN